VIVGSGGDWRPGGGIVRPYLKAGISWPDTDQITTAASFAGAQANIAAFAITTNIDNVVAGLCADFALIARSGTAQGPQHYGRS
jgi:hypothetical protein